MAWAGATIDDSFNKDGVEWYRVGVTCDLRQGRAHWAVVRRYSQFHDLKRALEAAGITVRDFPRKHLTPYGNSRRRTIQNRRHALGQFVAEVVLAHLEMEVVTAFLEVDLHIASRYHSSELLELHGEWARAFSPGTVSYTHLTLPTKRIV
eukprot:TRINITY_DN51394_c0_g1_i1.p1 TRINITY_DN51394_c0_g1~~TRINITY_DN51394_c0_g1_i1.p1  ORF type:complete len:150 (-),score=19.11 TRINITY_DN51394_c0_g1_i1:111-560(-)